MDINEEKKPIQSPHQSRVYFSFAIASSIPADIPEFDFAVEDDPEPSELKRFMGTKMTLELADRAIACNDSNCRIWRAAGEFKISADSRIS
jgi:hypothetical protein